MASKLQKIIGTLLAFGFIVFPVVTYAYFSIPWTATSTTQNWIFPLPVNGTQQTVVGDHFIATGTPSSVFPYASSTAVSATTICLTGDICRTTWPSSGGSGGGTWSTTTSNVSGQLTNSPNNNTDIVTIGNSSTTTAPFWFDPNTKRTMLTGSTTLQTATSTSFFTNIFGINGTYFNSFQGSGLTTSGGALTCATASGSVFGCLGTGDWTRFNSATTTFASPIVYTSSTNSATVQAASGAQNGYLSSGDYTLFHSATTTFSSPLTYTNSTNAVTCPTCNTSSLSGSGVAGQPTVWTGTNSIGASSTLSVSVGGTGWNSLQSNTVLLGNGTGNIATTSQGTAGQVLMLSGGVPVWAATSSSASVSGGTAGMLTSWVNATTLTATSGPTAAYYTATSTTATSTLPLVSSTYSSIYPGTTTMSLAGTFSSTTALLSSGWVKVLGRYAYMTSDNDAVNSSFTIFDVGNPANITQVGQIKASANSCLNGAEGFEIQYPYAYVTGFVGNSFSILNISSTTNPTVVACITDATNLKSAEDVQLYQNYAIVLGAGISPNGRIATIDITNPNAPFIAATLSDSNLSGGEWNQIIGTHMYVVGVHSNFITDYNISNPKSITVNNALNMGNNRNTFGFAAKGKWGYTGSVSAANLGIGLINLSTMASSTFFPTTYKPWTMRVAGNYLFVTSVVDASVHTYDISSSTNPVLINDFVYPGSQPDDIWLNGNYAYIADNIGSIDIFNVPNITTPMLWAGNIKSDNLENEDSIYTRNAFVNDTLHIGAGGFFAIGSSTVAGSLTAASIIATSTATSTFAQGINLSNGCFAINSVCVGGGGGSGTVTSVTLATPNSTLTLGGTNPVTTSGTINADLNLGTSNTWTSTKTIFNNYLGIGTTTPQWQLEVSSSTASAFTVSNGSSNLWSFRALNDGTFALGTSSPTSYATNTPSVLILGGATSTISSNFQVGASLTASTSFIVDQYGHIMSGGPVPVCGAGCSTISGDENDMRIITGTSVSTALITFANTWRNGTGTAITPNCVANEESGGSVAVDASSTPTTVLITFATSLTAKDISVTCRGSLNYLY